MTTDIGISRGFSNSASPNRVLYDTPLIRGEVGFEPSQDNITDCKQDSDALTTIYSLRGRPNTLDWKRLKGSTGILNPLAGKCSEDIRKKRKTWRLVIARSLIWLNEIGYRAVTWPKVYGVVSEWQSLLKIRNGILYSKHYTFIPFLSFLIARGNGIIKPDSSSAVCGW